MCRCVECIGHAPHPLRPLRNSRYLLDRPALSPSRVTPNFATGVSTCKVDRKRQMGWELTISLYLNPGRGSMCFHDLPGLLRAMLSAPETKRHSIDEPRGRREGDTDTADVLSCKGIGFGPGEQEIQRYDCMVANYLPLALSKDAMFDGR